MRRYTNEEDPRLSGMLWAADGGSGHPRRTKSGSMGHREKHPSKNHHRFEGSARRGVNPTQFDPDEEHRKGRKNHRPIEPRTKYLDDWES